MKDYAYKMKDMSYGRGNRVRYTFADKTRNGESLIVELIRCENLGGPHSIPNLWKDHGYIDRILENFIGTDVFATDEEGNCRRRYDPQLSKDGRRINFDWILEDTPENRDRIIAEICRRAFEEVSD